MADIAIVGGWIILSSAPLVLVVGPVAILVLIAAPFAEEPWLKEKYGSAFEAYAARVSRFL
jgi:protein-S-isoprenylcysteine O-methyltransferase Ste14